MNGVSRWFFSVTQDSTKFFRPDGLLPRPLVTLLAEVIRFIPSKTDVNTDNLILTFSSPACFDVL